MAPSILNGAGKVALSANTSIRFTDPATKPLTEAIQVASDNDTWQLSMC
ncbi:MAG: hypothetical protein ACO1N8_09230 [Methylophilus sp.]